VVKLIRLHRGIPRKLADVQRLLGELEYDEFSLLLGVLRADNLSKLPEGEDARAAAKIAAAQEFARRCREEQLCCRVRDLAVRGGDLAALGLQGEEIGLALHFLLDAVISGQCRNEKDYSLEYLRKNLKNLGIAQEK
jgi:tRNA nucleotidyltransferase (CCA-adding enzyme)